jgi:hypothetical protein
MIHEGIKMDKDYYEAEFSLKCMEFDSKFSLE